MSASQATEIRNAWAQDADAACAVLWRSILQLCKADHGDDPAILAAWLANKTPAVVASWVAQPGGSLLVALHGDATVGVGGVADDGTVRLNYVAPEVRFRGVSTALLAAMEARARKRGATRCHLVSTGTAHRFYLARGYRDDGPVHGEVATRGSRAMSKPLVP